VSQTTDPDEGTNDPRTLLWEEDPYAKTDPKRLARRLLHSWIAIGLTLLVIIALVAAWKARGPGHPGAVDVTENDVVEVIAFPQPWGTGPPHVFASSPESVPGAKPLDELRQAIPSPLPGPVECQWTHVSRSELLELRIKLADGRTLDYLACHFPDELGPLHELAMAG